MNQPPNTTEEKCEHKEPTGQWAVRGGKSYATCKNCGEEYETRLFESSLPTPSVCEVAKGVQRHHIEKIRNGCWKLEWEDGSFSEHSTQDGAERMAFQIESITSPTEPKKTVENRLTFGHYQCDECRTVFTGSGTLNCPECESKLIKVITKTATATPIQTGNDEWEEEVDKVSMLLAQYGCGEHKKVHEKIRKLKDFIQKAVLQERERLLKEFNETFRYSFGKPAEGSKELNHNNVRDLLDNKQ